MSYSIPRYHFNYIGEWSPTKTMLEDGIRHPLGKLVNIGAGEAVSFEEPKRGKLNYAQYPPVREAPREEASQIRKAGKDPQEIQRVYNKMWDGSGEGPFERGKDHNLQSGDRSPVEPEIEGNHFNSLFFDDIAGEASEDSHYGRDPRTGRSTYPNEVASASLSLEALKIAYEFFERQLEKRDAEYQARMDSYVEEKAKKRLDPWAFARLYEKEETPLEKQTRLNKSGGLH